MSDSLDFHDVSVWGVKSALVAAYQAGLPQAKAPPPAPLINRPSSKPPDLHITHKEHDHEGHENEFQCILERHFFLHAFERPFYE